MNFYDCKGGPGTTEPACGACVSCLHRVIEEKDARIKRLEAAGDVLETCAKYSCTRDMEQSAVEQWRKAKEAKP